MENTALHARKDDGSNGTDSGDLMSLFVNVAHKALLVKTVGSSGVVGTVTTEPFTGTMTSLLTIGANTTASNVFGNTTAKGFSILNSSDDYPLTIFVAGNELVKIPAGALYETPPQVFFTGIVNIQNSSAVAINAYLATWG